MSARRLPFHATYHECAVTTGPLRVSVVNAAVSGCAEGSGTARHALATVGATATTHETTRTTKSLQARTR